MKFQAALLSLLVICHGLRYASAQKGGNRSDEMYRLLEQADTSTSSKKALALANRALKLAKGQNDATGITLAEMKLGNLYIRSENFPLGIKHASLAMNNAGHADDSVKEHIHQTLSNGLEKMGAFTESIYHAKKALAYQKKETRATTRKNRVFHTEGRIGYLYLQLNRFDSALTYYNHAMEFAKQHHDLSLVISTLNNIGITYFRQGNIDSARSYYRAALDACNDLVPEISRDFLLEPLIKGNLAECLDDHDPMKESYLLDDISNSLQLGYMENAVLSLNEYALLLIHQDRNAEALRVLQRSDSIAQTIPELNPEIPLEIIQCYTQLYINTGNKAKAKEYHKKHTEMVTAAYGKKARDQLLREQTSYKLARIRDELKIEKIQSEKNLAEIEALNNENKLARFRIWSVVGVTVLILIMLSLILAKFRSDTRRKNREKELKNQLLAKELQQNTERLDVSVQSIARKKKFVEELMGRIAQIDDLDSASKSSLKLFAMNELEIDSSILDLEKQVTEIGEKQMAELRLKFPALSENDMELLGYIKMKLTNKQIAKIKNVATESVKTAKNRLRKKLNLSPGDDFSEVFSPTS